MEIVKKGDKYNIKRVNEEEIDKRKLVHMYFQLFIQKQDLEKDLGKIILELNELEKYLNTEDLDHISNMLSRRVCDKAKNARKNA